MKTDRMITKTVRQKGIRQRVLAWGAVFCACAALTGGRLAADITPPYGVKTFAGYPGSGSADGTGEEAMFNTPNGVAVDGTGAIYVADTDNSTIRKLTSAGVVTTWAGIAGVDGISDGTGAAARFNRPFGIAAASDGRLFVSDTGNHIIRQISAAGAVSVLAGMPGQTALTNGTGTSARFNLPAGLAYDGAAAVLYVADAGNKAIRKVSPGALVETVAVGFGEPAALALSADRTQLYVADIARHVIVRVTIATGAKVDFAGLSGTVGSADGLGTAARFDQPKGLAFDPAGNLYVAEANGSRIRRITPSGDVTSVAGSYAEIGGADGTGTAARFLIPSGLAYHAASGRLLLADSLNSRIRWVDMATGAVSNLAGPLSGPRGYADGTAHLARFNSPRAVARDSSGNLYIADRLNHVVRKVTPAGVVTTLAGLGGQAGSVDGAGADARFNQPAGVVTNAAGTLLYVADLGSHVIRKIVVSGGVATVSTFAGSAGLSGSTNDTGTSARFNLPQGLALDGSGNVFVADFGNNLVRKITPAGVVSTFAPSLTLSGPTGLAVDTAGNVYVADSNNQVVWRATSAGSVSLFAGAVGSNGNSADAPNGLAARFFLPFGVTLDGAGFLYVADYGNHVIRRITINPNGTAGAVQLLAGTDDSAGAADGVGNAARFRNPQAVLAASANEIYIVDTGNNALRRAVPVAPPVITSSLAVNGAVNVPFSYAIVGEPFSVLYEATGLPAGLTLNASNGLIFGTPFQAGVFPVAIKAVGLGGDANATLNLTIAKGAATVVLGGLTVPYDGTAKIPAVQTTPASLAVNFTFNGSATPPTAVGTYSVVATVNDANFQGSATGTLQITAPVSWRVLPTPVVEQQAIAGIAVAANGTLYFADPLQHVIRRKVGSGALEVFAGEEGDGGYQNGTGSAARFDSPSAIAISAAGDLYVADTGNHSIRKITPTGVVSLVAGSGNPNMFGSAGGVGSAALFTGPAGLTFGPEGALYVADTGNGLIRKITLNDSNVTAVGIPGGLIYQPVGIAVGPNGALYVSDYDFHRVWRFEPAQTWGYNAAMVAGGEGVPGFHDGNGTEANFYGPRGIALAGDGYLYVADEGNHALRRVAPNGDVTTVAGLGGTAGRASGYGTDARFTYPTAVAMAADGGVYLSDQGNSLVLRLSPPPSVPVITSALTATAVEGAAFSGYTLTASGSPTGFYATGLPAGLSLHPTTGVLSGTAAHSGVYTITLTAANELGSTNATLTLTIAPPAWNDWLASHFTIAERSNPAISGATADPDGDGVPNLIEYYQDKNPRLVDGPAAEASSQSGYLTMSYQRRRGLASGQFTVQVSTDLVTWSSGAGHTQLTSVETIDARFERVTERSNTLIGSTAKQFIRLKVQP